MTGEFCARALLLLADCGVKSVPVLAAAWLSARLLRRSAAARHLVWRTAFVVLLLLPLLSSLVPSSGAAHVLAVASIPEQRQRMTHAEAAGKAASIPPGTSRREEPAGRPKPEGAPLPHLMGGAVVLWLCGVGLVALRLALAHLAIAGLRRRSRPGAPRAVDLEYLSSKAGMRGGWELRTSLDATPSSAMTWGVFRPVVLLPRDSAGWSRRWLEAVLLHELAHVRRRDYVSQLLAEAVCALYWWNPFVWVSARALRAEAERAADDSVLDCGVSASAYAAELLRSAAAPTARLHGLAGFGLSITNGSPIESRIRSIVEPHHRRGGASLIESAAAIAAGVLTLVLLIPYRSVGLASGTTEPEPPARGAARSGDVLLRGAGGRANKSQARHDSGRGRGRAGPSQKPLASPSGRSPAVRPSDGPTPFGADVVEGRQDHGTAGRGADLAEVGGGARDVSEKMGADVLPVSPPSTKTGRAGGQARSPDVWWASP